MFLIDTNVAIDLLDGNQTTAARIVELPIQPMISVLSRVELEGGVYRDPGEGPARRARLDLMLDQYVQLAFTTTEAAAYARIIESRGFSRAKIIDRMIAATTIAADATLITGNARDFRGIEGLRLLDWSA